MRDVIVSLMQRACLFARVSHLRHPRADTRCCRVNHGKHAKNGQGDIGALLCSCLADALQMQQRRVDEDKWHTCKTTNERNKLVEIIGTNPGKETRRDDDEDAKHVLRPFGLWRVLARFGKESRLQNTNCRKELQWCREKDSNRVQQLNCIDESI